MGNNNSIANQQDKARAAAEARTRKFSARDEDNEYQAAIRMTI